MASKDDQERVHDSESKQQQKGANADVNKVCERRGRHQSVGEVRNAQGEGKGEEDGERRKALPHWVRVVVLRKFNPKEMNDHTLPM